MLGLRAQSALFIETSRPAEEPRAGPAAAVTPFMKGAPRPEVLRSTDFNILRLANRREAAALWAVGWRLEPPLLTRSPPALRAERSGAGMEVGWTQVCLSAKKTANS